MSTISNRKHVGHIYIILPKRQSSIGKRVPQMNVPTDRESGPLLEPGPGPMPVGVPRNCYSPAITNRIAEYSKRRKGRSSVCSKNISAGNERLRVFARQ